MVYHSRSTTTTHTPTPSPVLTAHNSAHNAHLIHEKLCSLFLLDIPPNPRPPSSTQPIHPTILTRTTPPTFARRLASSRQPEAYLRPPPSPGLTPNRLSIPTSRTLYSPSHGLTSEQTPNWAACSNSQNSTQPLICQRVPVPPHRPPNFSLSPHHEGCALDRFAIHYHGPRRVRDTQLAVRPRGFIIIIIIVQSVSIKCNRNVQFNCYLLGLANSTCRAAGTRSLADL
jgi:hypothetical protein